MPFMMPLLCVAARYGSTAARAYASTMRAATSVPDSSAVSNADAGTTQRAEASRRSARLERMRKFTRPPVISSTTGANASQAVLTMLAPIASRQS